MYGLYITLNSLLIGCTVVALNKFQTKDFLESIENFKITKLFVVPPIAAFLAKSELLSNYNMTSVKNVYCGAAPLHEEIYMQLSERFVWSLTSFLFVCIMFVFVLALYKTKSVPHRTTVTL